MATQLMTETTTLNDLMEMSHACVRRLDTMDVKEIVQEHDYEDAYEASYYHDLFNVELGDEWSDRLRHAERLDCEY